MPKQIKLTDGVAEKLAQRAKEDSLSLAGEVNKLLTERGGENAIASVVRRLDCLEQYIDKKFSELKSLVEDTTVDRVAGGRSSHKKVHIEWNIIRDLCFEFLRDKPEMWVSTEAKRGAEESDNMQDDPFYTDGEVIYSEGMFGHIDWVKCTPEVMAFLKERGVDVD